MSRYASKANEPKMALKDTTHASKQIKPDNDPPFKSINPKQYGPNARQIIVKTQQPDIPLIAFIKTQNSTNTKYLNGVLILQSLCSANKVRSIYTGIIKIACVSKNKKNQLFYVKLLNIALQAKIKNYYAYSMKKIMGYNREVKTKETILRLIIKIMCSIYVRKMSQSLNKMNTHKKTEVYPNTNKIIKHDNDNKPQQNNIYVFSQQFINKCKTLNNFSIEQFMRKCRDLKPATISQLAQCEKFYQEKKQQQIILVTLRNTIDGIIILSEKSEEVNKKLKSIQPEGQKDDSKLFKELSLLDMQLRKALETEETNWEGLEKTISIQLQKLQRKKNINQFQKSRLFLIETIDKLIIATKVSAKNSNSPVNNEIIKRYCDRLQELIKRIGNYQRLKDYRQSITVDKTGIAKQRYDQLLIQLTDKILVVDNPNKQIQENALYENQDQFEKEIKAINREVIQYIEKLRANKMKTQIFGQHYRQRQSPQFKLIYDSFVKFSELAIANQQALIAQNNEQKQMKKIQRTKSMNKSEIVRAVTVDKRESTETNSQSNKFIMKILNKFIECLRLENYDLWEQFCNDKDSVQNKSKFKSIKETYQILEKINDFLNQKIEQMQIQLPKQSVSIDANKIKELNKTIETLKREKQQLGKSIKSIENKSRVSSDANKIKQLNKTIETLKREMETQAGKHQTVSTDANKIRQLNKTIETLKREMETQAAKHQTVSTDANKIKQLNKTINNLKREKEELAKQIKSIQSKSRVSPQRGTAQQKQKTQIKQYQVKISTYMQTIEDYKQQSIKQKSVITKLQKQLQIYKQQSQAKVVQFENQLTNKNQQINRLSRQLREAQESNSVVHNTNAHDEYDRIISHLNGQISQYQQKIGGYQRQISSLKQQLNSVRISLQKSNHREESDELVYTPITVYHNHNSLQSSLSLFSQEYKKSQQLVTHLKAELQTLKNNNSQEIHHMNQQFDTMTNTELQQLLTTISELRAQIKNKDEFIIAITGEINRLKVDVEQSKAKYHIIEHKDQRIRHLQDRLTVLNNKVSIAQQSSNNKQNYINKLEHMIQQLNQQSQKSKAYFQSALNHKQSTIQNLKDEIEAIEMKRNEHLLREGARFQQQIGQLRQIQQQFHTNASKSYHADSVVYKYIG